MTTTDFTNFDIAIDFNSLFTLNYSFEVLKGLLETLVKNQKVTNTKLSELENNINIINEENE